MGRETRLLVVRPNLATAEARARTASERLGPARATSTMSEAVELLTKYDLDDQFFCGVIIDPDVLGAQLILELAGSLPVPPRIAALVSNLDADRTLALLGYCELVLPQPVTPETLAKIA